MPFPVYLAPSSLDLVFETLLANPEAKVLAGGTDLLLAIRKNKSRPTHLIDLAQVPGLDEILEEGHQIRIGSMVKISHLANNPTIRRNFPSLATATKSLGSWQIRNAATIGGNLCNAAPSAELAPALLTLQATAIITGPTGDRELAIGAFFKGPGQCDLAPGEILREILIPFPPAGCKTAYYKHSLRQTMDLALVNVAVLLVEKDGVIEQCRVALGAVAPVPMRAQKAEKIVVGYPLTSERIVQAAEAAASECRPITDIRATADYRRHMIKVLVNQALSSWAKGGV
ncbi:MAG: FAD binding domain-containing protein [Bacillota bacterium]